MIDLDNICEYYIWWPDKDNKEDPNKQVCPNWAPSLRIAFNDEDDEDNTIYIRLCPEHLNEIHRKSRDKPRRRPSKLKYYRVRRYSIDQDIDGTGEIIKEGYDYRGDGYIKEMLSIRPKDEEERDKYRYVLEEVFDKETSWQTRTQKPT